MTTEDTVAQAEVLAPAGNLAAYRVEQETQNTIARAHPRNPKAALENALMELEIAPEYACKSFYVIPYTDRSSGEAKKVNVEGPSIKAAITLARNWGNNASGWRIKDQNTERVEVEGVYVDHETNVRTVRTKTASRFYTKKGSNERIQLREEALVKAIAAAGSKAVRDAIIAGEPFWYTDSYYQKAREIAAKTIGGKSHTAKAPKTYAEKLAWVQAQLAKKGVTKDQFDTWVASFDQEKTDDERIADIVGVYNAIHDGQATIAEVFGGESGNKTYQEPRPKDQAKADAKERTFLLDFDHRAATEVEGKTAWTIAGKEGDDKVKVYFDDEGLANEAAEIGKKGKVSIVAVKDGSRYWGKSVGAVKA